MTNAEREREKKVLILLSSGQPESDPQTVVIAMSQASWDHIKDGKTHTLDLRKVGINVLVLVTGGPTQDDVVRTVQQGLEAAGCTFEDRRGARDRDLGIDDPTVQ